MRKVWSTVWFLVVVACAGDPAPTAGPDAALTSPGPDGGTTSPLPAGTCTDGLQTSGESGVDCGGPCAPCPAGGSCQIGSDCQTLHCWKGKCLPPGRLLGPGGGKDTVAWTPVLTQKLKDPVALGFSPEVPGQLWVANRQDGALTVLDGQTIHRFVDQEMHFLEKVSALAFSDSGTFATCGDTRNDYHGNLAPDDFMGPVMWPASLQDFLQHGPDAAQVHLDMMHDSPWCMGVAAQGQNRYFVFNGKLGTIDAYDFAVPHPHGGTDHSDGGKHRYLGLGLQRVAGVPSHLAFDAATGWLYVADTGGDRIVRLDTQSGKVTGKLQLYANEVPMELRSGATLQVLATGVNQPSGLVLHEGFLYFTEAGSGVIQALSLDGKLGNAVDTGLPPGSLAGLAVGPDGRLYLADRLGQRVLRLDPP